MTGVKRWYAGAPRVSAGLVFVLLMTACNIVSEKPAITDANHPARVFTSSRSCMEAVALPAPFTANGFSRGRAVDLLSWNIQKGSQPGWLNDLKKMAGKSHLVMLQEALLIDEMKNPRGENVFWSFSPGYQGKNHSTGLMTISPVSPDIICSLQATEPWLNTPKAASIIRYPIKNSFQSILLVNAHAVNFAFGLDEFKAQVDAVARVLSVHDGPMILSGDFNTWKDTRLALLNDVVARLGLTVVEFTPDQRTQWFGSYLDHMFVRGFDVVKADTPEVTSSDHNPLMVRLILKADKQLEAGK